MCKWTKWRNRCLQANTQSRVWFCWMQIYLAFIAFKKNKNNFYYIYWSCAFWLLCVKKANFQNQVIRFVKSLFGYIIKSNLKKSQVQREQEVKKKKKEWKWKMKFLERKWWTYRCERVRCRCKDERGRTTRKERSRWRRWRRRTYWRRTCWANEVETSDDDNEWAAER